MSSPEIDNGFDEEQESNGDHDQLGDYTSASSSRNVVGRRTHGFEDESFLGQDGPDDQHRNTTCHEDGRSDQHCRSIITSE
jgi:hypothetical protein